MHERRAWRHPRDELHRVDAGEPGPAEVDLQEQPLRRELEQPVENGAAVVERSELAVVVVEAEPQAGRR